MSLTQSLLVIAVLIATSAFFSLAEISLAASRRLRLRQMADEGDARAERVLRLQEQPGHYFTVVQIGLNAVAILGGVVGEGSLGPVYAALFEHWLEYNGEAADDATQRLHRFLDAAAKRGIVVELTVFSPAIVENCLSSGVATDEAIVSGLAPGSSAVTCMVG